MNRKELKQIAKEIEAEALINWLETHEQSGYKNFFQAKKGLKVNDRNMTEFEICIIAFEILNDLDDLVQIENDINYPFSYYANSVYKVLQRNKKQVRRSVKMGRWPYLYLIFR